MNVQDRRRILGPSEAKPLVFSTEILHESNVINLEKNDEKNDSLFELPNCQNKIISNCNGSSIVETTKLSLLTSVYGPRSTRQQTFQSRGVLNIILQCDIFSNENLKELSQFLISILENCIVLDKYPKSGIDIFVEFNVYQFDDLINYIPYLIIGILISLIDADIEIFELPICTLINDNVICLGQNGSQIIGFWKDQGNLDNLTDLLDKSLNQYSEIRKFLNQYISKM